MSNYDLVKQAIKEKKQIHCQYSGKKRLLCPHLLGKKGGKEHGLFYQFDGSSVSGTIVHGSPSNWRCMAIAELTEIELLAGPWHTVANFDSATQKCIEEIDEEVEL